MPRPRRPKAAPASRISREIDRDERVVLHALRRRLLARLRPALRLAAPRDLPALLDALTRDLADARTHARRLNDARIIRRSERPQHPTGRPPPPALAVHAYHGDYLGACPDLPAVANLALTTCLNGHVQNNMSRSALTALALDLHLRGVLWTLDHDGALHVFLCRA